MKSVIILCGGRSRRMGRDKGSLPFKGKPMINYVLDTVKNFADEIVLVLRDEKQWKDYEKILNDKNDSFKIVIDKSKGQGPLIGILSGLSNINSDYAQILPCDSPFISKDFVLKMFVLMETNDFDSIVPIWDDGNIEPLHSIYKKSAINIIEDLIRKGEFNVKSLIQNLNVKYIDVKELDETKRSFQNINTINDIR